MVIISLGTSNFLHYMSILPVRPKKKKTFSLLIYLNPFLSHPLSFFFFLTKLIYIFLSHSSTNKLSKKWEAKISSFFHMLFLCQWKSTAWNRTIRYIWVSLATHFLTILFVKNTFWKWSSTKSTFWKWSFELHFQKVIFQG